MVGRCSQGILGEPITLTASHDIEGLLGPPLPDSDTVLAVRAFLDNGGQRVHVVPVGSPGEPLEAASLIGSPEDRQGLHALDHLWQVDLLCLPATVGLGAAAAAEVITSAARWADARGAFLLADLPLEVDDLPSLVTWLTTPGLRHRSAALYHPWVSVDDHEVADGTRTIGAAAAVAGVIARTDHSRGVWKAPAGLEAGLRGIVGLAGDLTAGHREQLGRVGVNVLRDLPDRGPVVWGARTLVGDGTEDEWRYVPVRRTVQWIERSVERSLGWVVGEPNGPELWTEIRVHLETFLHGLFLQGALRGTSPDEAYLVRCGPGHTMTFADVVAGEVVIEVGVALLKPGEFHVLRIRCSVDDGDPDRDTDGDTDDGDDGAIGPLAERLDTVLRLDALTLPAATVAALRQVVADTRRPGSRGVRVAFTGPSRPGKALAARALAGELGTEVLRVDLQRDLSRFIGETEKHLRSVLDAAAARGAVLLFDEADALFGRRTAVDDAHDRSADQAVAVLRARLREHPALVVLAAGRSSTLRRVGLDLDHEVRL